MIAQIFMLPIDDLDLILEDWEDGGIEPLFINPGPPRPARQRLKKTDIDQELPDVRIK